MTDKQIRKLAGQSYPYPVRVVEGNQPPTLVGRPYWKTSFTAHHGRFHKILYTPSSRKIIVGRDWLDRHDPEIVYNDDSH